MIAFLLASQLVAGSVPPVAHEQGIVWTGPKLTPEEAARILAISPGLSNLTNVPLVSVSGNGPEVFIIPSSTAEGPYGPFPRFPPSRPLNCCEFYQVRIPRGRFGVNFLPPTTTVGSLFPFQNTSLLSPENTNDVAARGARRKGAPVGATRVGSKRGHRR